MKKLVAIFTAVMLSSNVAFASPPTVKVVVNGTQLNTDTPAIIRNSRTMVPFRALFEALGAKNIDWNEATQTVSGSDGATNINLVIGSYDIDVNGKTITMDTPPMIINSRTMIPLSAVSSAMGGKVEWNSKEYIATVTKATNVAVNTDVNNSVNPIFSDIASIEQPASNNQSIPSSTPATTKTVASTDNKALLGYYAMEDLKRNKYVLNLKSDGTADMVNISSNEKTSGKHSYSNTNLKLNISSFNGTYQKEIVSYAGTNLFLMKDSKAPTSGSTFVLMSTTQTEYEKYVKK